jgi:hypothetical protein
MVLAWLTIAAAGLGIHAPAAEPSCDASAWLNHTCLAAWPEYASVNASDAASCCSQCESVSSMCAGDRRDRPPAAHSHAFLAPPDRFFFSMRMLLFWHRARGVAMRRRHSNKKHIHMRSCMVSHPHQTTLDLTCNTHHALRHHAGASDPQCAGWTMNKGQTPPCHLRPWSDASPNAKPECTSGIFEGRRPAPPVPPRPAPPGAKNVLFIVVDDLRPMLNESYEQGYMHTPNLDKLARQGLVFRNAYCQYAYCAPSR